MPFRTIKTLPESVKDALPADAEKIFLRAFNSGFEQFKDEERAFRIAWGAVKNAGFKKQPNGKWKKVRKDSKDSPIVKRFDFGGINGSIEVTPQGYLKVPANLTRTGIFTYTRADGSKIREYRPPEEVFNKDSLATLAGAPVTDLHPLDGGSPVLVSPKNHRKFSVGIVGEEVKHDDTFVIATLTVMDNDIIQAIQSGERREISLGYNCRVDFEPGTTPSGEKYDAIQRNITYNHAAVGPKNWGRAGNQVALKLDSGDAMVDSHYFNEELKEEITMENTNISMKIDGVDYELPKQTAQAIEKALGQGSSELKEANTKIDSLQGKLDALQEELENEKKNHNDSEDPSKVDALVQARLNLLEKAKKILGDDYKFDGKNKDEIVKEAVALAYPEKKLDEKSADYLNAAFDIAVENHKEHKTDSMEKTHEAADQAMKADQGESWDPAVASKKKLAETSNLWKNKL